MVFIDEKEVDNRLENEGCLFDWEEHDKQIRADKEKELQGINQNLIDFANKLKDNIFQDDDIPSKYGRIVWKHIDELLKEMEKIEN